LNPSFLIGDGPIKVGGDVGRGTGLGPNSFDEWDMSVELEELHERVAGIEGEHATEAMKLSRSVREISDALGVFPIWDIPQRLKSAQDVLMAAGLILEHLREENAFGAGPWV
jgi:hypothetical protein